MDFDIQAAAKRAKAAAPQLAALPLETRNQALYAITEALIREQDAILKANQADLAASIEAGLPEPIVKRLKFDETKLQDSVAGIRDLIGLPDPLFKTVLKRQLDKDLLLERITCPIGVIGVIFESRPDALVQISTLCLKSGNCALLKGGSEARQTNRVLFDLIYAAGLSAGLPEGFLTLIESREDTLKILELDSAIDLLIPRGSNEFVKYIMDNTRIPVMGHADGVCHIYIDAAADPTKAAAIVTDAKTQYVAACNTLETLLVHRSRAAEILPLIARSLAASQTRLLGDAEVSSLLDETLTEPANWSTEHLDYVLAIRLVNDLDEAIDHINRYGSHHTDSIVTEDSQAAARFMLRVDSAGVYHNCSTRFADGFRYGFGAEVGISTSKLHARGPVGLEGLVTYKYRLTGDGNKVDDYATGRRQFHFKDLPSD